VSARPVFSFVLPIYNEEAVVPLLLHRLDSLLGRLDGEAEVIFVDDGSTDCASIVLQAKARDDNRYRYIRLSRNFGHQIAVTTGLDFASGDAVIVMDADLQDPPETVLALVAKWREGYDIVNAERATRAGESRFKKATASLFYRALSRLASVEIARNVGDFRLIDRKALEVFRAMPERERFVRGMFAWVGFNQANVVFDRLPRAAGTTKYSLAKMARLAVNGLVSFSDAPLRVSLWAGMGVSAMAMIYGVYVIGLWLTHADLVPGWSSTIVVTSFLCGANMLLTGIMGLYVGRIYTEVKGRPLYVIERAIGFADKAGAEGQDSSRPTPHAYRQAALESLR
jgi:dolichol-phosphate mannosyltransferase